MNAAAPTSEVSRLLRLAWPVVLSSLGIVTLTAEDVLIVGQLGERQLAVVSAGHIFHFGVMTLGIGTMRGLDPLFAQAHGAGDRAAGAAALGRAIVVALMLSIPLGAAHWFAEDVLVALGQPAAISADAGVYARLVGASLPFALVIFAIAQFLQGLGQMKRPMVAVAVANAVNIVVDLVVVNGWEGPAGVTVPQLGALGAGWATLGSRVVWLVVLLAISRRVLRAYRPPRLRALLEPQGLLRTLALGVPVGVQTGLETWAFSAAGLLMGALGARELAAHAIAMNIISVSFMIPMGIGAAAATRVGNLVGAGAPWVRSGWLSVGLGAGWMMLSAMVLLFAPAQVAGLYTGDAAVLSLTVTLLPIAAAFQLFDGIQAVSFGVLRGAGDVRVPALCNVLGYWCVGLPLGWWYGVHTAQDPVAIWACLALALVIVSMLLLLRLGWRGRRGAVVVARDR